MRRSVQARHDAVCGAAQRDGGRPGCRARLRVRREVALAGWLGLWLLACGPAPRAPAPPPGGPPGTSIDRPAMVERVRAELRSSWRAYTRYAWGHDELRPVTRTARDWYGESILITPVDALDALVMMGLTEEAAAARALIDERLSFDKDITVKNFEITIRVRPACRTCTSTCGPARCRGRRPTRPRSARCCSSSARCRS
ncbi:MAG: hypothetical protein E6J91_29830 [Deltaproteobacteria bacterium]|nr:MAG: hypothetical protein E6J91_29830 [Deltaproteobacteria bacterium]